eukprot:5051431-Heterocapsa_arctica.AAC.1
MRMTNDYRCTDMGAEIVEATVRNKYAKSLMKTDDNMSGTCECGSRLQEDDKHCRSSAGDHKSEYHTLNKKEQQNNMLIGQRADKQRNNRNTIKGFSQNKQAGQKDRTNKDRLL